MHATLGRDALIGTSFLVVLLVLPVLFPQPALRDFLIYVMAYGLLALSLNLLIGLTGLVAFGHAAFFGFGAYAFGLAMQSGRVSFPVALLFTVGASALLALGIGAVCVRLKDIYFSFITLACQMFLHSIIITANSNRYQTPNLPTKTPTPVLSPIRLFLHFLFFFRR